MPYNAWWDMSMEEISDMLRNAGLRPTRQRLAIGRFLWFNVPNQHITAEKLHHKTQSENEPVSLATVYNTLHQFTDAGLLREVVIDGQRSYFDTHVEPHYHFYCEETRNLVDIPFESVDLGTLPTPPEGSNVAAVDVIIRLRQCNLTDNDPKVSNQMTDASRVLNH